MKLILHFLILLLISPTLYFAQTTSGWKDADTLKIGRDGHAGINLDNGYIMVTGGYIEDNSGETEITELFNTTTQLWEYGPPMNKGRFYHRLIKLDKSSVIAIGGFKEKTCEILDLDNWTWSYTDSLEVMRHWWGTTATLMEDGNIIITGGGNFDSSFASCEIYDSNSSKWRLTSKLSTSRERHTATLLKDGRVLVTGGRTFNQVPWVYLKSCEIFDPKTETWSYVDSMKYPRANHSATLLPDGRVLVIGGEEKICEIYDPTIDEWMETGEVELVYGYNSALLLQDNKYLLLIQENSGSGELSGWELFSLERFESVNSAAFTRKIGYKKSIKMNNNTVLTAGGLEKIGIGLYVTNYCQIYDITTRVEEETTQILYDVKLDTYPNPFNNWTNITVNLPTNEKISLSVFNILGEKVTTVYNGYLNQGKHRFNYTPINISSGTYFLQLESQYQNKSIKLIYLK